MKRCPECRRDYYDDTLLYCLDDGNELLEGPAKSEPPASAGGQFDNEPSTAILPFTVAPGEASTGAQINTSGQTAILSRGADAEPQENSGKPADRQSLSARRAAKPLAALIVAVLILVGGVFSYWYFVAPSSKRIDSIAVLPFQNRSDDADTDYLSDGLAESLIFRLTQLPGLKVSPTSSVVRYKGNEIDVAKIAGELGVDAVMTGRLAKRGETLNITVELVDARSNTSLWGEQYERKMSDLLATQREIAATIAQKLQMKLSGEEKGVTKKYTDDNEAYQLWMKGRFHFARRTKVDMERSIELFRQATELDPKFALAYVGIAESYTSMPSYPYISPKEASPHARAAITRAVEIDPELPEARAVAAMIATTDEWDYAKAEREFKKAIEIGPNLAITHYRYGWTYLSPVGRHEEAIAEMKRAMELEPLAVQQGSNYAAVLMYARRFDEAVEQARRTYELDPNQVGAQNWLCHTLNARGLYPEAVVVGERFQAIRNRVNSISACLGIAYARTEQRERSLAVLATVKEAAKTQYVAGYWTAIHYAALGDKDAAFAELEKAFQYRDWFLPRLKVDPFMDPLRDDPRFDEMVKRLNLP